MSQPGIQFHTLPGRSPQQVVSLAEFARMRGVAANQVTRWLQAKKPIPSVKVGKKTFILVQDGIKWLAAGNKAGEAGRSKAAPTPADALSDRQAIARTELLEAQARTALAKAKRETGELVDRAAVLRAIQAVAIAIKTDLLEMPQSVADEIGAEFGVPVASVKAAIDRKVRRTLNNIADGIERIG